MTMQLTIHDQVNRIQPYRMNNYYSDRMNIYNKVSISTNATATSTEMYKCNRMIGDMLQIGQHNNANVELNATQ